jgi:hypothetical protein
MKVLVHLNHTKNKGYLLGFPSRTKVRKIIEDPDHELAILKLMVHSNKRIQIPRKYKQRAQAMAKFTISQRGYVIERLA